MSNLDVAVSSFWQLARHWKQGDKAKLELTCEVGSLHMQLSAALGHPDHPHFPYPPPPPPPTPLAPSSPILKKKKSPSQLRRQERRRQGTLARAEEAASPIGVKKAASTENFEKAGNTENAEVNVQGAEKDSSDNMYREVVQEAEMEKPAEKLDKIHVEEICLNLKCDQCEYTNSTTRGLSQHTRMKHRIPQLDGHIDKITADVAVQTLDVKKSKDSVTQTEPQAQFEEVKEDVMQEPFELKLKIPEKRFSSDIYDLYL